MFRTFLLIRVCLLISLPIAASAQNLVRVGMEFQVNTFTAGSQLTSTSLAGRAVAMDAAGNFVVVWISDEQDGDSDGIFAQRYNSIGVRQGPEFQVNNSTEFGQIDPAVAMDAVGNFIIVWEGPGPDGFAIFAKRYNAAGTPLGTEFRVTNTPGSQRSPSVAMTPSGAFVIAWTRLDFDQNGSSIVDIGALRFNSAGQPQGSEFKVNTTTADQQFNPALAIDPTGNFVITWTSERQEAGADPSTGVYAQRFNAAGVPQGVEFHVNTFTERNQELPSVAMDATGNFVVAWQSFNQDGDSWGVYAQRFDATGTPQGSEFQVSSATASLQTTPSVTTFGNAQFLITFSSLVQSGDSDVFGRRFSSGGDQGPEFLINTETARGQAGAHVVNNGSSLVVVWTSSRQDGDGLGVFGQRYSFANPAQRSELLISEFRLNGPLGPDDDYLELYNNTDSLIDISGYTVVVVDRSGSNLFTANLPDQTGMVPRGHYLIAGNILGLDGHRDFIFNAPAEPTWLGGIGIMNRRGTAIDSVLFSDTAASGGLFVNLLREGNALPQIGESAAPYAWVRDLSSGLPKDTDNNLADFVLVSSSGGSIGGVPARLGAPGPENSTSPIQSNATIPFGLIDATASAAAAPNRSRDLGDTGPNKTLGTMSIRRRFINQTGSPITQLRFRIIMTTSGPAPVGTADLRALSSGDVNVPVGDNGQCAPNPAPCSLTVKGTTLEESLLEPLTNGGGLNATLSAGHVTLAQPLAAGSSVNIQFLLGVQQSGIFRFYVNIEALQ